MVNYVTILSALPLAACWPGVVELNEQIKSKRQANPVYPTVPAPNFTPTRDNCGSAGPCTTFDAKDQYVDVSEGSGHEFQAPGPNDLRGQCPGLNAAANHNFLPRNGIATIADTINGLGSAYSMSVDLSTILAVVSIALAGDYLTETWSIGGSYPSTLGLLGTPQGIIGTHNRYEGDASIVRGDAYLHDGNVGVFEMHKWENLYQLAGDSLTHNAAAAQMSYTARYSEMNNPYYFSAPFSGAVAPDAHDFVVNFMSNHSEEVPGGTLTRETLMSFFSVTGEPGNFLHTPGQERIPDNWYKRPTANAANTASVNVDMVIGDLMYPGILRFGGNTGTVNSFTGVDTGNLTGGVYDADTLLQGNNLACFMYQATQAGLLDQLGPLLGSVSDLTNYMDSKLAPFMQDLSCPQLSSFNNELFQGYPGASYRAQGQ